jgi:hypothetical protein
MDSFGRDVPATRGDATDGRSRVPPASGKATLEFSSIIVLEQNPDTWILGPHPPRVKERGGTVQVRGLPWLHLTFCPLPTVGPLGDVASGFS